MTAAVTELSHCFHNVQKDTFIFRTGKSLQFGDPKGKTFLVDKPLIRKLIIVWVVKKLPDICDIQTSKVPSEIRSTSA